MGERRDRRSVLHCLREYGRENRSPLVISRRGFLAVAGAAFSSSALAGGRPDAPKITPSPDELGGQTLTVAFANYTWSISTSSFSPGRGGRTPALTKRESDDACTIELSNAAIAGTNLAFNFQATISNPGNGWCIDFVFNSRQSDAALQGAERLSLFEWITGSKVLEFSGPSAIPAVVQVGQRSITSADPEKSPKIVLQCIGVDGDRDELDKRRLLRPAIIGRARLFVWFPADVLNDGAGSKIDFSKATIDLLPRIPVHSEPRTSFPSELFGSKAMFGAETGFDDRKPHALFQFSDLEVPEQGYPLANVTSRAKGDTAQVTHTLRWIPGPKFGLFGMMSFELPDRSPEALVHLGGSAIVNIVGPGTNRNGSRLHFQCTHALGLASQFHRRVVFGGMLENRATLLEADHSAFLIEGRAIQGNEANNDAQIRLDCRRGNMSNATIPVRLLRAHVPAAGTSVAMVDFPGSDAAICIGELDTQLTVSKEAKPSSNGSTGSDVLPEYRSPYIHFGSTCAFRAPLGNAQLTVKRSSDLFDIVFEFRSYWIESANGIIFLDRRVPQQFLASCNCPTLVAVFPPQHVQERVFAVTKDINDLKSLRPLELAQTLISGSTRIAMQGVGDLDDPGRQVFELTIENLTDWHDLALAVHRRALPTDADTDSQLDAVNLSKTDSRNTAKVHWRDAMMELGVSKHAPDYKFITQIEAVSGLIVSPDHHATFDMPLAKPNPDECRTPLWTARLNLRPLSNSGQGQDSCVRVIHARGTELAFVDGHPADSDCEHDFTPFRSTLTARDRTELLVLTSGFGLPSLRRLQMDSKKNDQYIDDPKGMVFRPQDGDQYAFLSPDAKDYTINKPGGGTLTVRAFQEGILVPRPFQEYALTLSSLKACLRSVWEGEPPAPYKPAPPTERFYAEALNIQGYTHRVSYGRDALVQVAYKGFLFPLGHRVALIKVSERQIRPARDNDDKLAPTDYLIKRNMIVCQKPLKPFPALGQPYSGRDFPTSSVEMITVVTPDIIDPDEDRYKNQLITLVDETEIPRGRPREFCGENQPKSQQMENPQTTGRVFWPRTAPGDKPVATVIKVTKPIAKTKTVTNLYGNELKFEYKVDGSPTAVTSPLIFVDNTAAHDQTTMRKLVEYYNDLKSQPLNGESSGIGQALRTATHCNATRTYAPSLQSGETSFETIRWTLGATGAKGADNDNAPKTFTMDALMEGADQPPFYPRVHRAFIKMQSLDRLLGRAQGLIETAFSHLYVEKALDPVGNPSEIFLDVIGPAIELNVTSQGQSAGGVAQPNALLAAISRRKGMIGGQIRAKPAGNGHAVRADGTDTGADDRLCDFAAAESGQFDPAEFLGGGLGEAKILGIVPLKEVIRIVAMNLGPQLQEVQDFAEQAFSVARTAAPILSRTLKEARDTANRSIETTLAIRPPGQDLIAEFYPELSCRFASLIAALDQISASTSALEGIRLIGPLIAAGRALAGAIEATAKNPMPAGLQEYITKIRKSMSLFLELCAPGGLKKYLSGSKGIANLFKKLSDDLAATADLRPELETIFGTGAIADILRHPQEALNDLQRTSYFQAFARPLLDALTQITKLINLTSGIITWSRARLAREIAAALADGNADTIRRLMDGMRSNQTRADNASLDALVRRLDLNSKIDVGELLKAGSVKDAVNSLYARIETGINSWVTASLSDLLQLVVSAIKNAADDIMKQLVAAETQAINAALSQEDRARAAQAILTQAGRIAAVRQELEAIGRAIGAAPDLTAIKGTTASKVAQATIDAISSAIQKVIGSLGDLASPAGMRIRERIKEAVKAELTRSVQQLADDINALARESLEEVMARLLSGVRGLLGIVETLSAFVALAEKVDTLGPKGILISLRDGVFAPLLKLELDKKLAELVTLFRQLEIPVRGLEVVRSDLIRRVGLLRGIASRAQTSAERLVHSIDVFANHVATLLTSPTQDAANTVRNDLEATLSSRRRLLDDLQELSLAAADTIQCLKSLTQVAAIQTERASADTSLQDALTTIYATVQGLVAKNAADVLPAPAIKALDVFVKDIGANTTASFAKAQNLVAELKKSVASPGIAEINAAFGAAVSALEENERMIIGGLTTRLSAIADAALKQLSDALTAIVEGPFQVVLDPVLELHNTVAGGLDALNKDFSKLPELVAAIARPGLASLNQAYVVVNDDRKTLAEIKKAITDKKGLAEFATDVTKLVSHWSSGDPGLVESARIMSRLVQSLLKGQLSAFVDFSGVRALLENELFKLLPTKFSTSYDWDTTLDDFPRSDPIFLMDRSAAAIAEAEAEFPKDKLKKRNDLVLSARVEVDLRKGSRQASAIGLIAPFQIRLLGNSFDLITIGFKGATFEADVTGRTNCKVQIGNVRIGNALEFLEKLQSFFSPGGNGPYVTLSVAPPAIEAGYRFSQPLISMGAMSLLNIDLSISALLPFDQQPALFRFAFASREKPFLISIFPYGGGGFVGLTATARGITRFEVQFEFGAVVAIQFGPLRAHGRIAAGIYLMVGQGEWALEGFVHAMGAGQIACFGISVNIEIRVRAESGGAMAGSAKFELTISIGFFSITFSITASERIEGKRSTPMSRHQWNALTQSGDEPTHLPPQTVVVTPRRYRNWTAYRQHLALS